MSQASHDGADLGRVLPPWRRCGQPPWPSARYSRTAFTRRLRSFSSLRPSLAKIELVCFSTARSDTLSEAAMAALLLPCAISARISDSRGVSDDMPGCCWLDRDL